MSNAVTEAFNEQARQPGSKLRFLTEQLHRWPTLSHAVTPFLPRPLFVDDGEIRRFGADVMTVLDLVASLPERFFDGDVDRFAEALGITGRQAYWSRRLGGAAPPHFGRCDMNHDGTSFKLLELGIGSETAGWDRAGELPRAMLEDDEFAEFAERHGLTYVDAGDAAADVLRRVGAGVVSDRDPVYVVVEGVDGLANFGEYWEGTARVMRERGLDFHVAEVGHLRERDGKLYLGSLPVDVVFRCFEVDEICDDHSSSLVEPICRAHDEGSLVIWTPLENNLYGDKGCLAMLSGQADSDAFTAADREVIDRVLPWTRALTPASLREDDFVAHCRADRENLFLKPAGRFGGIGSLAGWQSSDREWWQALQERAEEGAVVQAAVHPAHEPVVDPVSGEIEPWKAVWSAFYTPDGFAGAYARTLPAWGDAVIGASHGGRFAAILHYGGTE